ncbi:hypothetical protein [Nocardia sp. NRRL S-836]|uniref:hypothetical protein n=1 Tax=Nocardia sp. NRRL S-836 TaxID=1519492 RepID=UPI0006ADF5B6|nr:hypothetical protein [Nocardia sp. NRRL S-836]KOV84774.1 hypothetical protein ADL03_16040 [Nocardia sp. NRRL S-836]
MTATPDSCTSSDNAVALPRLTQGQSSKHCLDAGLVCSIGPATRKCTECAMPEDTTHTTDVSTEAESGKDTVR